jgi:RNA polymerase sigma factor (sigma-70 family)
VFRHDVRAHNLSDEARRDVSPEELAAIIEVVLERREEPKLLEPEEDGAARRRVAKYLEKYVEQYRLCRARVRDLAASEAWQLSPAEVLHLALGVLPHYHKVVARPGVTDHAAMIDTIIRHWQAHNKAVTALLDQTENGALPPPGPLRRELEQVAVQEYQLEPARAEALVLQAWPAIARSLQHYHYTADYKHSLFRSLDNYHRDGATVQALLGAIQPQPAGDRADSTQVSPEWQALLTDVAKRARSFMPEQADDLASEALLAISKGLPSFYFGSRFSSWVETIVRNSRSRVAGRHPDPVSLDLVDAEGTLVVEPADPGPPASVLSESSEIEELLRAAIHRVSLRFRDAEITAATKEKIGLLHFIEGWGVKEIAAETGVEPGNVSTIIHRIKKALFAEPALAHLLPVLRLTIERLDGSRQVLPPDAPARRGSKEQYRLSVTNIGGAVAPRVLVAYTLPTQLTSLGKSVATEPAWGPPARYDANECCVQWEGAIKPAEAIVITLMVELPHTITGPALIHTITATIGSESDRRRAVKSYTASLLTPLDDH